MGSSGKADLTSGEMPCLAGSISFHLAKISSVPALSWTLGQPPGTQTWPSGSFQSGMDLLVEEKNPQFKAFYLRGAVFQGILWVYIQTRTCLIVKA